MRYLFAAFFVACVCTLFTVVAAAQTPRCGDETERWVARCNGDHGGTISLAQCPAPGLFVLHTTALRIEVNRDATRAFRRVNGWGLSPIGYNGEWSAAPATLRAAFEHVARCMANDGSLPVLSMAALAPPPQTDTRTSDRTGERSGDRTGDRTGDRIGGRTGDTHDDHTGRTPPPRHDARRDHGPARGPIRVPLRVPWRLLTAAVVLGGCAWPRRQNPLRRRDAAVSLAVVVALMTLAWLTGTPAFFHQNGQGPMWVDSALTAWLPYGPGFSELFNIPVRLAPWHPERALFVAQSLLMAFGLVAAWRLAQRCAAPSPHGTLIAGALAVALVLHPSVQRIALSETYFASCMALELLGAWALSHTGRWRGDRYARLRAIAPALAGGLLLSCAVAVHPVSWLPSALVPLVLVAMPGSARSRMHRLVLAYVVVGFVVLLTAAPGVVAVLRGELGQRWIGQHPATPEHVAAVLLPWVAAATVCIALVRHPLRAAPRLVVALALVALVPATDVITSSGARPVIVGGFVLLHVPVVLAVAAAVLVDVPRVRLHGRVLATAIVVAAAYFATTQRHALTALPTDAREQHTLLAWRTKLPAGATVLTLARAGNHILAFPLYPATDPLTRQLLSLDTRTQLPPLRGRSGLYWYRSSVCTTVEGRAYCDAIERRLTLTPVASTTFAAMWSLSHLPFDRPWVHVALSRVTDVRAAEP